jgi:hypothetical protein
VSLLLDFQLAIYINSLSLDQSACIQLLAAVLSLSPPMALLSSAPHIISIASNGLFSRDATVYAAYGYDLIELANSLFTAFPMHIQKV